MKPYQYNAWVYEYGQKMNYSLVSLNLTNLNGMPLAFLRS